MATHSFKNDEILDVVCVGFGPASLSLAIALHEQARDIKVRILDRKSQFSWRGDDLPNSNLRMRTNLIHDLVSQRNPQSHFTFVNYLWNTGTLVSYLNLGLLQPPRKVFSLYLRWCSKQIEELGWVRYGTDVTSIEPVVGSGKFINHWRVVTSSRGGASETFLAKKVVVGVGSQAALPRELVVPGLQGRIQHSAKFGSLITQMQQTRSSPLNVAIIGANCDAVEMIEHCQTIRDDVTVTVLLEEAAFRQTDANPFIGSLVSMATTLPYELRKHQTENTRPGNTVDESTLKELFDQYYRQLIRDPNPENHKLRLETSCHVFGAHATESADRVQLQYNNLVTNKTHSCGPFDFVFVATSSENTLHEGLTKSLHTHFDSPEGRVSVDDGYRINFKKNALACGRGVWLLNGFEADTDDAFSYLALRTERVRQSIMGECIKCKEQPDGEHAHQQEPSRL